MNFVFVLFLIFFLIVFIKFLLFFPEIKLMLEQTPSSLDEQATTKGTGKTVEGTISRMAAVAIPHD